LSSEPAPGAVQQIESLRKAKASRDAGLVNAMVATPTAIWLLGGTPQDAENAARDATTRGARQGRVPVFVAYDLPFHDCTGYGAGGAANGEAYEAWIDGFGSGIGNERAVVILEPNSLGLVPYGVRLDGTRDACKPSVADSDGKRSAPPGASPADRYALLRHAVDSLATRAPNAAVYLDGTHSNWLPVGEIAFRLAQSGINQAAGFFLNAGNSQPTPRLVQYGTWIAKCLHHAGVSAGSGARPYRECASPPDWADSNDDAVWSKVEAWYAESVDHATPGASPESLAHFVINTNRNGLGPLSAARYAGPPFNQPPAVVEALRTGGWCMPPGLGVGLRPSADTKLPLVDAFLWTDVPGMSVASCDIAGGARAWDYSKYNPWGITGDAQNHFDPLWGMVLPPAGAWFPEQALQLARNANPPLESVLVPDVAALEDGSGVRGPLPGAIGAPPSLLDSKLKARDDREGATERGPSADVRADVSGRPGTKLVAGPRRHPGKRSAGAASTLEISSRPSDPVHGERRGAIPPTFDPENPYR
jgi:endoglucanase